MEAPEKRSRVSRVIQNLGLGSLAVGVLAGVLKAWVTYWLGPGQWESKPHVPPAAAVVYEEESVASASERTAKAEPLPEVFTVETLLKASPIELMDWQRKVESVTADDLSPVEQERLFRDYVGKEVVWEGFFDQCNPDTLSDDPGKHLVLVMQESRWALSANTLLGPPFIRCLIPASNQQMVSNLEKGDWIAVRGRISNPVLAGTLLCTDLKPCEILATGKVRNVEVAVETDKSRVVR